ncbi:DUF3221 domain-containing protein [Paenisporosarcina cavernae]|uniref:DUF3221 domain-containing protein n=1 Tax=Paenisporosarcina cavernae TaxID=2320858 RepID=A0A385YTH6_9BACL|nr:DUF3221 domain-containing protein [Paenisporosarcina cavernae]AYC30139.1 hypothetical protein D3873_09735 [Paenisporosarcina cavernae]
MKKYITPIGIAVLFIVTGCGTAVKEPVTNGEGSGSEVQKKEIEREIIVELKQPKIETPERDKVKAEIKERPEFKDGIYGKQTDELAENLTVQQIEGPIAITALEEVYGGQNGFQKEGIIFYGTDENPGFWIGIKNPDERLDELVKILQAKVDSGVISAKYIHIFKSDFTHEEQRALMDQVNREVKKMVEEFHNPNAVGYSVSVDTLTGNIEIDHNFLTEKQIEHLKESFDRHKIVFSIQGKMAPDEGEPDVIYPEKEFTTTQHSEGELILGVEKDRFFTGSMYYDFTDAKKKLKTGQRVLVSTTGMIMESFPGQGRAVVVEILPDYKPDGANLTESQVVAIAAQNKIGVIEKIEFNQDEDEWIVSSNKDTVTIGDK